MFGPAGESFRHVCCDLRDLLGTPELPSGTEVAHEVEDAVGGTWHSLASQGLFLAGDRGDPARGRGEAQAVAPSQDAEQTLRRLTEVVLAPGGAMGTAGRVATTHSPTGTHEVWQQLVRGAPVAGAVYAIHQSPVGQLAMSGTPLVDLPGRDPGPVPRIDPIAARRAMRRALDLPTGAAIDIKPVVFPVERTGIWAVKGECLLDDPVADLRIYVAVDDLSLLLSHDVAAHVPLGEGRAYPISPSRTVETAAVVLDDLVPDPTLLRSPCITVRPAKGLPVNHPLGDYRVDPGDASFNQISAYYHVRRALHWFADRLGPGLLDAPPFTPLEVVVDDRTIGSQVAVYVPGQAAVRFSSGRRNGARSADIVVHEVAHAIADRICRLSRSAGNQARALGEGYADYAAATMFDDPRFGDYVREEPTGARNCSDPALRFPPSFDGPNEPYSSGQVWAAVLWDLRTELSPSVADAMVLNSLVYLSPNSTFDQAVAALLEADRTLFGNGAGGGRHATDVRRCFSERYL